MTLLQIVTGLIMLWLAWDMATYLRSRKVRRHFTVLLGWKPVQWLAAWSGTLAVLSLTIALAFALIVLWPPVMGFTWFRLLASPADGPVEGQNLYVTATRIPWVGWAFLGLLLVNVPRLARLEEWRFRDGTEGWKQAALRSLHFGLIHCVIGVPLAAGIALSLPGLWFTLQYWKGGIRRSTFYHCLHNYTLLTLLAAYLAMLTFG